MTRVAVLYLCGCGKSENPLFLAAKSALPEHAPGLPDFVQRLGQ
jgi:hypothetical protein